MKDGLKVAVVMGGPSAEHAISLKSGHGVVEALTRRHVLVEPLTLPQATTIDTAVTAATEGLTRIHPEVVFIALQGIFGEDGTIQQLCEDLHLAYTGSDAQASRVGMDKIVSHRRFEAAGLTVPRWHVVPKAVQGRSAPRLPHGWSYPVVVKPNGQGSSLGVSIVRRPEELPVALTAAGQFGSEILLEAFIAGREITVGVLGDEPLPIVEIRPSHPFFDYTAKYTAGATDYLVPAPLLPSITRAAQAAGLAAHRAVGCRHFSRTDFILTAEGLPVVLEVNTIPGFTPTSLLPKAAAAAGLSYEELCEQLVMMAWQTAPHLARLG